MMEEVTLTPENAAKTLEWITVLCAAGLDYRLSRSGSGWHLHIPGCQAMAAQVEIDAYERDVARPAMSPAAVSEAASGTSAWVAFWCVYVLFLFFLWLGPYRPEDPLFATAAADVEKIRAGEWWRAITALTVHSGWPHLLANMGFLFFVGQAVFQTMGQGVGLLLILAGALGGNLGVALTITAPYRSVGASTAGFAALGIMSAYQSVSHCRWHRRFSMLWRRSWIPMASGMALLGFMGTAPQSDLSAHVFGFFTGALLAIPFSYRRMRLTTHGQWALLVAGAASLAWAWVRALNAL